MLVFLDLVEIAMEDMANALPGTMAIAIHSAAWDYSVDMVCTVTVDLATITLAVMVNIILLMVKSMGHMVVTLKDILSHTCNTKHIVNLKPIVNLQHMLNLKLMPSPRPILKRTHL